MIPKSVTHTMMYLLNQSQTWKVIRNGKSEDNIINNKEAARVDKISAELFKAVQDDAVEVPFVVCKQVCKIEQQPRNWKR